MSEWKEYKLGEIVDVIDSLHQTPKYSNIGYPMVRVTDIKGGYLKTENTLKVDKQVFEVFSKKHKPKKGDIVMSRVGSYGISCIVNNDIDFCLGQNTLFLVPKQNPEFLYYFLNSPNAKNQIESKATGTTQKTISLKSIKEIKVCLPSIFLQTAIAEILSLLDDKIELNNKINQELENLAQTLFKQWFVDFEFPNKNGEPYKSSGGEMVESDLGEIPKGWNVKTLKDEFVLNMGQSPKGDTYNTNGDGIVFFQGRSDFGFRFPSIRMYTNDPKKIAKKFETLISVRAPVGDINMVAEDCCIGRGLGSISHTLNLYSYTYHKILSIQDELKSYDNEGTVFGSINKETLGNIKNVIPPISICKLFDQLSNDKDSLIFSLTKECQELVKTRDTLLPKLISGELEINEINN